jgi:hypothetical protein
MSSFCLRCFSLLVYRLRALPVSAKGSNVAAAVLAMLVGATFPPMAQRLLATLPVPRKIAPQKIALQKIAVQKIARPKPAISRRIAPSAIDPITRKHRTSTTMTNGLATTLDAMIPTITWIVRGNMAALRVVLAVAMCSVSAAEVAIASGSTVSRSA